MATDKSLSIRQTIASESLAANIAEIKQLINDLRQEVAELKAVLAAGDKSAVTGRKAKTNEI